jgi:hypothetical protein
MTRRRDWKMKNADCKEGWQGGAGGTCQMSVEVQEQKGKKLEIVHVDVDC